MLRNKINSQKCYRGDKVASIDRRTDRQTNSRTEGQDETNITPKLRLRVYNYNIFWYMFYRLPDVVYIISVNSMYRSNSAFTRINYTDHV